METCFTRVVGGCFKGVQYLPECDMWFLGGNNSLKICETLRMRLRFRIPFHVTSAKLRWDKVKLS